MPCEFLVVRQSIAISTKCYFDVSAQKKTPRAIIATRILQSLSELSCRIISQRAATINKPIDHP